jgi:hypothetical protein
MTEHADIWKMPPAAMTACGCDRCKDGLRLHDTLDKLIQSQSKTAEHLDRLEASITNLETTMRA